MNGVKSIIGSLDFLSELLDGLQDELRPVEWVLDALQFIYNITVGAVVNPFINAFGIDDLFTDILNDLGLDIFDAFSSPADGLIDTLDEKKINPITEALAKLEDEVFGEDLLDPVNGDPENINADDLIIADDDTLVGDDIVIGKELNGDAGIDTVSYAGVGGRVAVFLTRSADVLGRQGVDGFVSIENLIDGTFGDDELRADDSAASCASTT